MGSTRTRGIRSAPACGQILPPAGILFLRVADAYRGNSPHIVGTSPLYDETSGGDVNCAMAARFEGRVELLSSGVFRPHAPHQYGHRRNAQHNRYRFHPHIQDFLSAAGYVWRRDSAGAPIRSSPRFPRRRCRLPGRRTTCIPGFCRTRSGWAKKSAYRGREAAAQQLQRVRYSAFRPPAVVDRGAPVPVAWSYPRCHHAFRH